MVGGALVPSPVFTGAMKMLAPPSLRSMRGAPCCMLRITSAPSMRSYHCAVASGLVVRRWMWSQVYLTMSWLLRELFVRNPRSGDAGAPRAMAGLGENLVLVVAERRRRRIDPRAAMGKGEGGERHAEAAFDAG